MQKCLRVNDALIFCCNYIQLLYKLYNKIYHVLKSVILGGIEVCLFFDNVDFRSLEE